MIHNIRYFLGIWYGNGPISERVYIPARIIPVTIKNLNGNHTNDFFKNRLNLICVIYLLGLFVSFHHKIQFYVISDDNKNCTSVGKRVVVVLIIKIF